MIFTLNKHNLKKIRPAQTLVEVILSIGILAIVLSALAILGMTTLKTSKSSLSRSEAVKLANTGIESVRYVRDTKGCGLEVIVQDISSGNSNGCYIINTQGGAICGVLDQDIGCDGDTFTSSGQEFVRKIQVQPYSSSKGVDEIALVKSTVSWQESVGTKRVVLTSVLTSIE